MSDVLLFTKDAGFDRSWPFTSERMEARLRALGVARTLDADDGAPIHEQADLSGVIGIAHFAGKLTDACIARAPRLKMVGCMTDNSGYGLPLDALFERDIPIIDATAAWGQSVAETGMGLALCALRGTAHWHDRMAHGEPLFHFPHAQFCDHPDFVNGDLGTKRVGVIGMGQIGSRVARFCRAFGAEVMGFDPYVPAERYAEWEVRSVDMDTLADESEVVFVAVPPTPSAKGLLNRERIGRLRNGAWVVVITRAHAVDMAALRERILANEVGGAFDVYDVEPLPVDDPLRGRPNVVHTPHIAGRTRDSNLRVADIFADEFTRILQGESPRVRLTRQMIAVRNMTDPESALATPAPPSSG